MKKRNYLALQFRFLISMDRQITCVELKSMMTVITKWYFSILNNFKNL